MECKLKEEKSKKECKIKKNNNQCKKKPFLKKKEKCKIKKGEEEECSLVKLNNEENSKIKFSISLYKNLFNEDNGVHELEFKDFKIENNKIFLNNMFFEKKKGFILFYAPWCSHCKEFKKEYEDLAIDYIQFFPFGSVNVENVKGENDKLRAIAQIESVPQLKFINEGGYLENFQSQYSYDDLLYFINMNL